MTRPQVRLVLLFIVACTLIFAVAPVWAAGPAVLVPSGTFEGGRAWRSSIGGYAVLSLEGSWHEMGRQYGGLLSSQLAEFYGAIRADLDAHGLKPSHLEAMQGIFNSYPEPMKELLRGMSETSGLSLEEHIILDASFFILPDLVIGQSKPVPSCSGIAVAAPRTADGKLYFARNWDMTPSAMRPYLKYLALVVFNPDDDSLAFANIRPIGQVYVETGINEKGVFIEVNNGAASDPTENPNGTFVAAELFSLLNECPTFDEVLSRLKADKLDSSYLVQVADAERAVSVEKPAFDTRVVEMKGGGLYALNNFIQPVPAAWKGRVKEIPEGYRDDRQPVLNALFASDEWNGHVTLESVKAMMQKTIDKGGPVVEGNGFFGTVIQVIAVPKDLLVFFRSWGYSDWGQVNLADLFGR